MTNSVTPEEISTLRHFNRFYTRRVGILDPYLDSDLSLTDVRALYELAHTSDITATDLARTLSLDTGYISRIVKRFEGKGWIKRTQSAKDARQSLLALTEAGWDKFSPLQERSCKDAEGVLAPLDPIGRGRVLAAMGVIEGLLGGGEPKPKPTLRGILPGDLGWLVQIHGEVYAREYGLDATFEAVAADIASTYLRASVGPGAREQNGWIAEVDGERVGGILVVNAGDGVAKIRLLILTPGARGLGLAKVLVDRCVEFARERGYVRMVLGTQKHLVAARGIYASRGFRLVGEVEGIVAGKVVVSEDWELVL